MTINSLNPQYASLSLSAGKSDSSDKNNDTDRIKTLKDTLSQANKFLQQIQSSQTDVNAQRKEAARQKIAQLKSQIQGLHMWVDIGAKSVAVQAANLARELARAVHEYASAGGTTAISTNSSLPVMPADASNSEQGVTTSTESTPDEAQSASDASTISSLLSSQLGNLESSNMDQDNANFIAEARKLLEELKDIVKYVKQKLQRETGQEDELYTKQGEQDIHSAEDSLRELSSNTPPILSSIDIFA